MLEINNADQNSIKFVDGDVILPLALTLPMTTLWRSIFAAFYRSGNAAWEGKVLPSEGSINHMMRNVAAEQKYIPRGCFRVWSIRWTHVFIEYDSDSEERIEIDSWCTGYTF